MAQVLQSYGTLATLVTTNLVGLSSSASAVWQSDMTINTVANAIDYEVLVDCAMHTGAPASDKALYVFTIPWVSTGSTWVASDIGTTTLPTGTEGTATINSSSTLKLLGVMNYVTAGQQMQSVFSLANAYGSSLPDGFSFVIENYSGTIISTTSYVAIRPISQTVS
jgi:hypothetical protein